jgi:glycerol dehydrogenase
MCDLGTGGFPRFLLMKDPSEPFIPSDLFGPPRTARVFISPSRYVQGPGVIDHLGEYLGLIPANRVAILASPGRIESSGEQIRRSLKRSDLAHTFHSFGGESSLAEIEARVEEMRREQPDSVVAFGGGKCIDTGKAVAFRLEVPLVVVPSLASNDAPCSASSVLYDHSGVVSGVEFYPDSPSLVVVDSDLVMAAPERFLVAGIGDAMATWYEARVVAENPSGISVLGARPTIAAQTISEACARTLYAHGVTAVSAVRSGRSNESLEQVIEANTLLSGLGFESGGLAAAHGVGLALTAIPTVHDNYLHGEMVAFGVIAQLAMQDRETEAIRVAEFFQEIGLPTHLGQLSVSDDDATITIIVEGTMRFPFTSNMPTPLGESDIRESILKADQIGSTATRAHGDQPYKRLHS